MCGIIAVLRRRSTGDAPDLGALESGLGAMAPRLDAIATYASIQIALSALDRLEVRGRDSAGLTVIVDGHELDLDDPTVARLVGDRRDPLFTDGAVEVSATGRLVFVYKVAAEIGE